MFRMKIQLFDDRGLVAEAEAEDPRLSLPPDWRNEDWEWRDADLAGWTAEAAAVWLEGCWECWPVPEPEPEPAPEQQGLGL